MPLYDLKCLNEKCEHIEEDLFLSFNENLEEIRCSKCSSKMKSITFGGNGTVFKGMGWASKNLKVKDEKKRKNDYLSKKQKEEHATLQLVPNIGGVEVDSFSDAAKLAKESGLDYKSYEKYAKEEKSRGRYEKPN